MVWEQKSPIVVMLTKIEEKGRKKCEQYWLQNLGVSYDVGRHLSVTLEGYKLYAECEVREFTLINVSDQFRTSVT
jgi:protein tyrosine phosphatase